ncbi:MAG: MmcB family DNA repair protein [Hyphomicrobiales bacterium]|nr:MmcB family DNA repair protein [Hyphomicrobiales bacterium]
MNPPIIRPDGRQSPGAMRIARGVRRMLALNGVSTVSEMSLPDGRRADLVALQQDGVLTIIEIKSSVADFRADRKWQDYRAYCDRLAFAIDLSTPEELIPAEAGLILADDYGARQMRIGLEHRLAPQRRKAMLLRFAKAAADRLHALHDPEFRGFREEDD